MKIPFIAAVALLPMAAMADDVKSGSCGEMIGERLTTDFNDYKSRSNFGAFIHRIYDTAMIEVDKEGDKPSASMGGLSTSRMQSLYGVEFMSQCDIDPMRKATEAMIAAIENVNAGNAKVITSD